MSPFYGPRSDIEWLDDANSFTNLRPVNDILQPSPDDISPNRNWREIDADGLPRGWGIDLPPARVRHHPFSTQNGTPPLISTMSRQTSVGIPAGEAWSQLQSLTAGFSPNRQLEDASRLPRPEAPKITVIPTSRIGFPDDTYGVRVAIKRGKSGGLSKPTGFTFIPSTEFAAGQGFRVFTDPAWLASGATHAEVYVTRPFSGGTPGTERSQGEIDLVKAAALGYADVLGPYIDSGARPNTTDESGLGRPPAPLKHRRQGLPFVDRRKANKNLKEGDYSIGYKLAPPWGGLSLVSFLTKFNVNDKKENEAIWFFYPGLEEGWKVQIWVYYKPPEKGPAAWYTVHRGKAIEGAEELFTADELDPQKRGGGMEIYGPQTSEKKAGRGGSQMTDAGVPGAEDETGLPELDTDSGPEVIAVGPGLPDAPGNYKVAFVDEDDLENETVLGKPASVVLSSAQTWAQEPNLPGNKLHNAEGSHRGGDSTSTTQTVLGWTGLGNGTNNNSKFEGGRLAIKGTGTGATLTTISPRVDIPSGTTQIRVMGRMTIDRVTGGTDATQYIARFYNDADTQVGSDTVLLQAASVGQLSLGDRGYLFGTGGTAIPADASGIRVVGKGSTSVWNSDAYIDNMGVFFQNRVPRKFESIGPRQPINFDPDPAVHFPHSSTSALGPVRNYPPPPTEPDPDTSPVPVPEPSVEDVNFETGAWPGTWPLSSRFTNTFSSVVETTNAVEGSYSVRHQDATTTGIKTEVRRRSFTSANLSNTNRLYFRWFDYPPPLPNTGNLYRVWILDAAANEFVRFYYTTSSLVMQRFGGQGGVQQTTTILSGLNSSTKVEVEVVVQGASSAGYVKVWAGTNGNSRTLITTQGGLDYTASNRTPRLVEFGASESVAGATWLGRADKLTTTINGSSSTSLQPHTPVGTTIPATAPAPDAPLYPSPSTNYRLYDVDGEEINQWMWFIEPGVERAEGQDFGGYSKQLISVIPGETITQDVNGSWQMLETSEEPSHQFFVTLFGPDVEPLLVGSPFGPGADSAAVSRTGGGRMNLDTGMAAETEWDDDDFWQSFVIPEGYYWASITPKNGLGGVYVWQQHNFLPSSALISSQTARDAKKNYGRQTSGSGYVVIDTTGEINPYDWPLHNQRAALGLIPGSFDGTAAITGVTYQSGATSTGTWSTAQADPTLVPDNTFYKINFTMTGESGYDSAFPTLPPGSVFVITKPFVTTLLRADRTEFPGGTFINGHDSPDERSMGEVVQIDGDYYEPASSKTVSYLTQPITIHVATEEAKREIEAMKGDDIAVIENPFLGGDGRVHVVRFGERPIVETDLVTATVEADGSARNVYGQSQIAAAQVVEEAPLVSP